MAISFIRIDDRIIHGQTVTRWANEYPCTGLIGVNDAAAGNKLLVSAFKGASSKKTFVWNKEHFKKNDMKLCSIIDVEKVGYYYQKFRWDFGITLDQMVIMII